MYFSASLSPYSVSEGFLVDLLPVQLHGEHWRYFWAAGSVWLQHFASGLEGIFLQ